MNITKEQIEKLDEAVRAAINFAATNGYPQTQEHLRECLAILSTLSHGSEQGGEAEPVAMWADPDSIAALRHRGIGDSQLTIRRQGRCTMPLYTKPSAPQPVKWPEDFERCIKVRITEGDALVSEMWAAMNGAEYCGLFPVKTPAVPDVDERAEFEKYYRDNFTHPEALTPPTFVWCGAGGNTPWFNGYSVKSEWQGWQARARLSNPNASKET